MPRVFAKVWMFQDGRRLRFQANIALALGFSVRRLLTLLPQHSLSPEPPPWGWFASTRDAHRMVTKRSTHRRDAQIAIDHAQHLKRFV